MIIVKTKDGFTSVDEAETIEIVPLMHLRLYNVNTVEVIDFDDNGFNDENGTYIGWSDVEREATKSEYITHKQHQRKIPARRN